MNNLPPPVPINVGFDGTNITIDNNNIAITHGDYTNLLTNTTELLGNQNIQDIQDIQDYMMIRTICDIIKDATNARISVDRRVLVTTILNQIFDPRLLDIAAEPAKLEEIKAISNNICNDFMSGRVFIKSAYTDHIPLQVEYVFNESGADPDTFSPIGSKIMSSFASVADPATRKVPTDPYPEENRTLTFDTTFMSGLIGFLPETTWLATQTSEFDRNETAYNFSINVGNNGGIVSRDNVTNNSIAKTSFGGGYYFQGNPTKNKYINRIINRNLTNTPENIREILKYMIIKEMGDMMQVYVMLVWFYSKNPQITKDKFVMSTTDLVVMNTCQLFKMPCLYTNQGKDSSMLTGQDKIDFDNAFNNKMEQKTNGTQMYKNWKKNNKFANTLYYLPFEELPELKKRRRLDTIYYIIKTQNEKQLEIFEKALQKLDNLRYFKMGRLGPLMTSFSNGITPIIQKIIQNIQIINHNLLVRYNELIRENNYTGEETDIELKRRFSLHILITRQKYPPTVGNTYVFVIQNLTHYTEVIPIGNGKLVDMILDNNIGNFMTIDTTEGDEREPELNNISSNPKVSGPGPNENWLIYSIANWFTNVRDKLNNSFEWLFDPIMDFSNNLTLVGGMVEEGENTNINNFDQSYEKIQFVTMMPCIYEQLCSIYEKHDEVYGKVRGNNELKYGELFVENFILNLTRYSTNGNKPTLTPRYNSIDTGQDDKPIPYSFNLIDSIPDLEESKSYDNKYLPYEEYVIHTDDIDFDIKNIRDSDVEFKEELIHELQVKNTNNNVFTVDDNFARELFKKSGIVFNKPQEQMITPVDRTPVTPVTPVTPISTPQDLIIFLSPDKPENKQNLFDLIITPLKEKNITGLEYLNNISLDTIDNILSNGFPEILIKKLNEIIDDKEFDDDYLKYLIKKFIETGNIPDKEGVVSLGTEMDDTTGGKFIKNKKTKRTMRRSRHKKYNKTNKRHKKHQKSGKNKTRKTKKAKRKNKTL